MHLLSISNLRNIQSAQLDPGPRLNILSGLNGSGKTSVLEAIYLLGRGKSFRSAYSRRIVSHNQASLTVVGKSYSSSGQQNTLGIQINDGRFRAKINSKFEKKSSALASILPLLLISPDGDKLIRGSPRQRRRFVDWGLFHVEHEFLGVFQRYNRTLQQRNAILRQKKTALLESWDRQLVDAANLLDRSRREYIDLMAVQAKEFMQKLVGIDGIEFKYQPGWPAEKDFAGALKENIGSDLRMGFTQRGPHRGDLVMRIAGRTAAEYLSGGQQKLAACSLLLAQASLFNKRMQENCIILVDDLPAELDTQHRQLFMDLLYSIGGQLFVTVTDDALLDLSRYPERKMFHVKQGSLALEKEDAV